jgi:uncharacterized membrane protein YcaP (DUF421 family)
LKDNLRQELMTENQLKSQLRQRGLKEPVEAAEAWMEGSGEISVIKKIDRLVELARNKPSPGQHSNVTERSKKSPRT